jgi:predicted ATP-grasp superfamily ATP-dependent carboligase
VLELNPRPPASLALYPELGSGGPFRAHLNACLHGDLPPPLPPSSTVRGQSIVFATRARVLDEHAATRIAAWPGACDLPRAGSRFEPGDPLCSVVAQGVAAEPVIDDLARQSATLRDSLETLS